jgi:uncharacterized membrane protein
LILEIVLVVAVIALLAVMRRQNERIATLEFDLDALRRTFIESRDGQPIARQAEAVGGEQAEGSPVPQPAAAALEPEPDDEAAETRPVETGPWTARPQDTTGPGPETVPAERPDIETALGTRWTVWIGGIALALGGIFLVRYSIEAGIFGPGPRIAMAVLFGLLLAGAGEFARRRGFSAPVGGIDSTYVPAILTAAGAFTLFGTVYAAHGIYGFIGATAAFMVLGALGLGTLSLALVHGRALAGLGLLGSLLTPILVSSDSPNAWVLFGYLAIVLAGAVAVAAIRRWRFLAVSAFIGTGIWSLAFLTFADTPQPGPTVFVSLVMIVLLAGLWLRPSADAARDGAASVVAVFVAIPVMVLAAVPEFAAAGASPGAGGVLVALIAAAAWRLRAMPLLHAAGLVSLLALFVILFGDRIAIDFDAGVSLEGFWEPTDAIAFLPYGWGLAALLGLGGVAMARRLAASAPRQASGWAFWAAVAPATALAMAWLSFGDPNVDWRFAAAFLGLALALAVAGEMTARAEEPALGGRAAASLLLAGASSALLLAIVAATGPLLSAVLGGAAAILPTLATRLRTYPALGWLSAAFAGAALVRVGLDPSIVGPDLLSATPVFNALLPAYVVPALAFGFAAWQLGRTTAGRPHLVMQAFAALFALLAAAMLTRHAMSGGILDAGAPRLDEQAIYTLIAIGAGAILLALDNRSPSPVFRYGSIAAGLVSLAFVAVQHFVVLNPIFTNESTGSLPFFNLLLIAYLLPAVALAALALYARGRRPSWYVAALALMAALLAFAWATLSVRRFYQGEFIGTWKGVTALETYTYSAVWLFIGVAILIAGLRLRLRVLRLGSAVLVVAAVAKVFLIDMSELEGVLRALSFIGLGAVLIGIGMFYQRMLARPAR